MKKIFALLMTFALIFVTGCGGSTPDKKSSENKELRLGTIKYLNVTETLLDNHFEKAASRMNQTSAMRAPKHVFFDNMNSMLAALNAGQIDKMSTYSNVANYLVAQHPDYEIITEGIPKVSDSFCCGFLKTDTALKKEFDDAILKLTADGTLKKLVETYITNLKAEPPVVDMPHFDGADTVKIAVTGDLPALDYISPNGLPAGFNTAVLAAISQQIGKNFELVQVDSGARAAALTSGEVNVIFWAVVPGNDSVSPANFDTPDGMIVSEPYYSDEIVHVKLKNKE